MRPQWVTDWLEALSSGKYPKGQKYLCRDGFYCCLGVLCEIQKVPKEEISGVVYYNDNSRILMSSMMEELQLTGELHDALTELNDKTETFEPVIAAIKEAYPE